MSTTLPSSLAGTISKFLTLTDPYDQSDALLAFEHALDANQAQASSMILASIPLGYFFQLLQTAAAEQDEYSPVLNKTCQVLQKLLSSLTYSQVVQDPMLKGALEMALGSTGSGSDDDDDDEILDVMASVRELGLSQVVKVGQESLMVMEEFVRSKIFKLMVKGGFESDQMRVAKLTRETLLNVLKGKEKDNSSHKEGQELFVQRLELMLRVDTSFCVFRDLTNSTRSTVRLRLLETIAEIGQHSREALEALKQVNLLDNFKSTVQTSDLLTRFNMIEILADLGRTEAGSEYLDESGFIGLFIDSIKSIIEESDDDGASTITTASNATNIISMSRDVLGLNAITKLFGKLGESNQVDFISLDMKYQILSLLQVLMGGNPPEHVFENGSDFEPEESLKIEALSSLGLIGGNLMNLEWVTQSGCMDEFQQLLPGLRAQVKVAWFHAVAQILSAGVTTTTTTSFASSSSSSSSSLQEIEIPPSLETDQLEHDFYKGFESHPGQSRFLPKIQLTVQAQQSPDLAQAGFSVLIALARYRFGTRILADSREFMSYLNDRNTEHVHAAKVAKFEIVEAMLKTNQYGGRDNGLLTPDQSSRLDLYRRQGPFYQRATATVAVQDIAG